MRRRHLVHVVSLILLALSGALGFTCLVALAYGDGDAGAFAVSAALLVVVGLIGYWRTQLDRDLKVREGYAVVSLAWLAVGVAGALPYLLSGTIESPVAALFESVSGFTTTGATVFAQIEDLPRGILFWRSLTQWLGGMGIIVLGIAILPFLGVGGMQLFKAEVPGPTPERLQPRIAQTAKLLWYVYGAMTAAQALLYLIGGMPPFEAITHAFTTLSTGGFSPRNASIAAYDSPYIQYVTILFMYLAGINFTLHYRAVTGRPGIYLRDSEWRFFTVLAAVLGAPPARVSAQETVVVVPATLAPDSDAALRDIVRERTSAQPIAGAAITVRLRPEEGGRSQTLYSGRTDGAGTADVRFRVPGYDQDRLDAELIVLTTSPLGENEVRQRVTVQRSYRLYLTSDKPLYQPGQTVHLRVLALGTTTGLPVAGRALRFLVHDPDGRSWRQRLRRAA